MFGNIRNMTDDIRNMFGNIKSRYTMPKTRWTMPFCKFTQIPRNLKIKSTVKRPKNRVK